MGPFEKLGKIFNLNRSFDIWLIDKVFHIVGHKDWKQYLQYPTTFCNVSKPYDKENHVARYHFFFCSIAEFAKKYNLMHILPLFCNADYCIVGSKNPMAKKYEIVKDENGFLVSQKI